MLNEFHDAPGDRPDDDAAADDTPRHATGGPRRHGARGSEAQHEPGVEDGVDRSGQEDSGMELTAVEETAVEEDGVDGRQAAGGEGPPADAADGTSSATAAPESDEPSVPEPFAGEPSPWPRRSGAEAGAGAARAEAGHASAGPPGEGDFGAWLRRQRELRAIDLREIADKTKISLRYLKAMEQDRFEVLPAPIFARGFLREYAKYVGLDADEVVNYYLAAHQSAGEEEGDEETAAPVSGGAPWTRGILLVLLAVLVVAALVYFLVYQRSRHSRQEAAPPPIAAPVTPPVSAPAEEPSGSTAEPAATVPAAPLVVTLDFTEECWVEAEVDGSQRVSRLFVAGESLQLEAQRRVVLDNLGNVAGVEVQVNGRPFALGTGGGRTARGVVIDLESAGTGSASASGGSAGADPAA